MESMTEGEDYYRGGDGSRFLFRFCGSAIIVISANAIFVPVISYIARAEGLTFGGFGNGPAR